jgi:multiple sugar transport system permease protein
MAIDLIRSSYFIFSQNSANGCRPMKNSVITPEMEQSTKINRKPSQLHSRLGYSFTLPAVVYLVLFSIFPVIYAIYLSFTADIVGQRGARSFSGLDNYIAVFSNYRFIQAVQQTIKFALFSTVLHILLGLGFALLFNQDLNKRFLSIARAFFLLPWAISPVVVGIIFRLLYSSQFSFISLLLLKISSALVWQPLSSTRLALFAVVIANVWHFTPYFSINILAGLQGIPISLYEAAQVDGASVFQRFIHITLPSLRRLLLTTAFFDFLVSMIYFDLVWILTQGGPVWSSEVIATHLFRKAFQQHLLGYAAAGGILLFITLMVMTAIVIRVMERE